MRERGKPRRAGAVSTLALAAAIAADCARPQGPPPIHLATPCAGCGMEVHDLRFACERPPADGRSPGPWRVYDAIECLIRDTPGGTGTQASTRDAWLADYDRQTLYPADSLWVVRGSFPSPMGGGFAAFLSRAAADSIAAATQGRVERLRAWLAHSAGPAAGPDHAPATPDQAPAGPDKAPAEPDEASR